MHYQTPREWFLIKLTRSADTFFVPLKTSVRTIKMSDSDSTYTSDSPSRKRKRTSRTRNPRKKPHTGARELAEGTSHTSKAAELARKHLAKLKSNILNELDYEDTYVYTPLKEGTGEDIRVLVIEPGKKDDPIKCRLVSSALPNTPMTPQTTASYPYTALSYFWGEGKPIHPITISTYKTPTKRLKNISKQEKVHCLFAKHQHWCNTGIIHVRSNLFVALQRFRDEHEKRTMWIDALCIDQKDGHERTAQVKKMHELYIQANKVSIWLGDGSSPDQPEPKPCFRFLRKLLDLNGLDQLLRNLAKNKSNLIEHANDIVSLMRNKWFSRRWVVQELALARPDQAEVVYGNQDIKWSDFSDAVSIFIKSQDRISPYLSKKLEEEAVSILELSPAEGVANLGANALVDFTNNLFRRSENGEIQQRMMTLEMLVSNLLAFESTDPRDTIYAVLSLAKDTHRFGPEMHVRDLDPRLLPDYKNKCLLDVYTDFIAYCIEKSSSLDILLRHWAPDGKREKKKRYFTPENKTEEEEEDLPTWIPLIHKSSYGTPSRRPGGRRNGDSFVGTAFRSSQKNYNAACDLKPWIKFGELTEEASRKKKYNGRLAVKGIRIGNIAKLAPRAPQGMIFPDTFEMAKFDRDWWDDNKEWAPGMARVPEGFWRTIVADRSSSSGGNTESWYPRACYESLKNLYPDGSLRPDIVLGLRKAPKFVKVFLSRVKDVMWDRRFALISLHGKETYALLPADTKKRDIICVLFGSSVPVVMRPHDDYWEMVGECFCYGQMEGEAVSGKEWVHPYEDAECFEIR
ncbi:hypothetical protein HYALB_00002031 [Hymenoscyphus albidus]|uniref:Heterokaryon incompatibility domain-containing protein n=1 Tax=Hymenoscyphus albidus TaxID=595503 RepID=A0A9N9LCW8_9HELO|nr:hypothetical protein HYALB_00002031 [Hymenoscyphus albidus]